jgi:methylmalonyl-CoA/ethylmalonyl-CoA epimerase
MSNSPNNTGNIRISQIGQIAISTKNLPQAVVFYRDILGLKYLFEIPGAAFFDCGGTRIFLTSPEGNEFDHPASTIYYKVQDILQAFTLLKERNVTFIDEPHMIARLPDHDLWMVFFRDPDQNILALMCEIRK